MLPQPRGEGHVVNFSIRPQRQPPARPAIWDSLPWPYRIDPAASHRASSSKVCTKKLVFTVTHAGDGSRQVTRGRGWTGGWKGWYFCTRVNSFVTCSAGFAPRDFPCDCWVDATFGCGVERHGIEFLGYFSGGVGLMLGCSWRRLDDLSGFSIFSSCAPSDMVYPLSVPLWFGIQVGAFRACWRCCPPSGDGLKRGNSALDRPDLGVLALQRGLNVFESVFTAALWIAPQHCIPQQPRLTSNPSL